METQENIDYKAAREKLIQDNGLTLESVFVPYSQSRNKDEKNDRGDPRLSLNWKVILKKNGREIITTDYSQGVGHIPHYPHNNRNAAVYGSIKKIVETGKSPKIARRLKSGALDAYGTFVGYDTFSTPKWEPLPPPAIHDVLYSLIMDSDVLDCATYEEWADNFGIDTDSRKGEAIYRKCLEIALRLRASLGDKLMRELRDSFQDY